MGRSSNRKWSNRVRRALFGDEKTRARVRRLFWLHPKFMRALDKRAER
jgi:hypothetical protein